MFKKYKIAQSAAKLRMGEGSTTKVNNKFMVIEKREILIYFKYINIRYSLITYVM